MNVVLTGATGYVGSHVLTELHGHGHEVTALVRDDTHANTAVPGWRPSHPSLVAEFRLGSYRK